jgi:uncharacterized membrane protein (DUF485 family)
MTENQVDWQKIVRSDKFIQLHKKKTRFLFGWWLISTAVYFALPLGSGFLPDLFRLKVIGNINFAYLFVILQFALSFFIAIHYTMWANRISDPLTAQVVQELGIGEGKA